MSAVQRKNKLKNLLNNSNESFYWLGFLLADGHFSKNGRLTVSLCDKDYEHLKNFQSFIENGKLTSHIVKNKRYHNLSVMDVNTIGYLKNKFKIQSDKTYNPPILSNLNDDQKFCIMIGFIDGDGSIQYQTGRNDAKLSVKIHSSWLNLLSWLFNKKAYIDTCGYAFLTISDNEILRNYKRKAIDLNLPLMNRKWDRIDTNRISRYEIGRIWFEKAEELKKQGLSIKEISKSLDIKYTTVYNRFKRKESK